VHTYKSGAFIQQCFASHPLSLTFKTVTTGVLVLQCIACRLRHQIAIENLTARTAGSSESQPAKTSQQQLARCVGEHATAVRVSNMNVAVDALELRCRDCRTTFAIEALGFETQAP
jgi:hypothetical protein